MAGENASSIDAQSVVSFYTLVRWRLEIASIAPSLVCMGMGMCLVCGVRRTPYRTPYVRQRSPIDIYDIRTYASTP